MQWDPLGGTSVFDQNVTSSFLLSYLRADLVNSEWVHTFDATPWPSSSQCESFVSKNAQVNGSFEKKVLKCVSTEFACVLAVSFVSLFVLLP